MGHEGQGVKSFLHWFTADNIHDWLLELHEQLRRTIETVRHENGVARRATEGLLNHVQGLTQAVVQAVAGAGLYSRGGAVAGSPVVVSSFAATG